MRRALVLVVLVPILCFGDSTAKRDKAVKSIDQVLHAKYIGGNCRELKSGLQTLGEFYKQGDKSVLPTLFRVTSSRTLLNCEELALEIAWQNYDLQLSLGNAHAAANLVPDKSVRSDLSTSANLRELYREALRKDPIGFLTVLSRLPDADQEQIAFFIAGGTYQEEIAFGAARGEFGLPRDTLVAIEAVLKDIPDSEPVKAASKLCLDILERINEPFSRTYFPPATFASGDVESKVRWYSLHMNELGEEPLWPLSSQAGTSFRLTYIPLFYAFTTALNGVQFGPRSTPSSAGPTVITFSLHPDGNGKIAIKTSYWRYGKKVTNIDESKSATSDQLARILAQLDKANFWTTPTELQKTTALGADWILEGVKDGKYRAVVRACPDLDRQSPDENQFAKAGRLLFETAGYKWDGVFDVRCDPFQWW